MREADLSGYRSPSNKDGCSSNGRRLKSRLKLLGRSLGQVKTAELDMDAVERNRDVVHQRDEARRASLEERDADYDKRAWASMYKPGE